MAFFLMCVYTVFLIFRPQDFIPALSGTPFMLIFLAGAALLTVSSRDFSIRGVPSWSLLALLAVMMLSSAVNGWFGGGIHILFDFGPVVATYFVFAHQLRAPGRLRLVCKVIVACTTLMVLHGVGQLSSGVGWTGAELVEGNRITWVGIFNDPNDLGLMFLVAIAMAVMLAKQSVNIWGATFWYLVTAFHIYGIYLTHSRGSMLTFLLMGAVFAYRRYGKAKFALLSIAIAPVMLYIYAHTRQIDIGDESAAGRIDAWYAAIYLFKNNPVFGVGMNAFTDHHTLTAHNSYLLVLAELGILGYLFWTLFVAASAFMVWSSVHGTFPKTGLEDDENKPFFHKKEQAGNTEDLVLEGKMILYALLAYLSAAFLLSRSYIVVLYIICGMALAHYHRTLAEGVTVKEISGRTLTVFLVVFMPASLVFLYLATKVLI